MLKIVFKNSYAIELLVSLSRNWGTCDRRIAARFPVLIFTSNYQPLSINVTFNDWKSSVQSQGSFLFSTHHFSLKQAYTFLSSSLGSCGSSACFVVVILLSVIQKTLKKIHCLNFPSGSPQLVFVWWFSYLSFEQTAKSWHGNPSYTDRIAIILEVIEPAAVTVIKSVVVREPNQPSESDRAKSKLFINLHRNRALRVCPSG